MPWPRRSEKERGNCGAAGDGGRVNNHSADDADKASTLPTRTLNASLSPVSRSLTSIQAKQPSQNSVSDRIHGMLKPRVRSVRERVLFFFDFDERCFAIDVDLTVLSPPPPKKKKKPPGPRLLRPLLGRPRSQPHHLRPLLPPRRAERRASANSRKEDLRRQSLRRRHVLDRLSRARGLAQGGLGAEGGLLGDRLRRDGDGENAVPQGGLPRVLRPRRSGRGGRRGRPVSGLGLSSPRALPAAEGQDQGLALADPLPALCGDHGPFNGHGGRVRPQGEERAEEGGGERRCFFFLVPPPPPPPPPSSLSS